MMNKLKFGQGRRTSAKQRRSVTSSGGGGAVHSIQSIMVGNKNTSSLQSKSRTNRVATPPPPHYCTTNSTTPKTTTSATTTASKRSTQVLVNEGTICGSIEFDHHNNNNNNNKPCGNALEATENNSSTASSAASALGDCSFASGPVNDTTDLFEQDDDLLLVDPYLDSDLQRQAREFDRLEVANSRPLEDSSFQLSPEDDDEQDDEQEEVFQQEMNPKSHSLFRRKASSSSTPKVITLNNNQSLNPNNTSNIARTTTTTPKNFSSSKQLQGGTLYTGATGPESDLEDEHQQVPHANNNHNSSAKLKSLGTFDFPDPTKQQTQPLSNTKSLVSGSFPIPVSSINEQQEESDDSAADSFPAALEYSFIQSPLSVALGKGFQLVSGATLTLSKVLFTTSSVEPPPTPVSQTSAVVEQEETNPRKSARMSRLQQQADHECDFWNDTVTQRMRIYGKGHRKVAEALLQLGQAYMLAREYAQAVIAFQSACRIWKQLERTEDDKLAFARYVDAIGMAWARVSQEEDPEHCHKAMTALEEAFAIRLDLLGPWHIDTVETLNKMASVHLHLREYKEACNAYWEVFWIRKAIFGPDHPSVAIAAHALGNVFVKLAATEDAANFFQIAVEIYDKMHLPNKHPAVARLMRDYKRLDRICLTSRLPPHARKAQR